MDSPPQYQITPHDSSPTLSSDLKQPLLSASETSKQRWKIFSLILISKFAYSLVSYSLVLVLINKRIELDSDARDYTPVLPVICGFLIYGFETKRAYQLIAAISALAVALATVGVERENDKFFKLGYSAFSGSYMGFFVVQIYMIIKYFRAKELSLAMGVFYFIPNVVGRLIEALYPSFRASLEERYFNGLSISHLMVISCLIGTCAALILAKVDVKTQAQEEGSRKSLVEDLRSIKPISYVLMGGIFLFAVTNYYTRAFALVDQKLRESNQSDEVQETWKEMNSFNIYFAFGACILSGWLADKKGKRITIMLLSFLTILTGCLLLFNSSKDLSLISLAVILQCIAHYSFAVSSWACLGTSVPQSVLGVVLGVTYAVTNLKDWMNLVDLSTCTIACAFGIILMIIGLVMDKKNGGKLDSVTVEEEKETDGVVKFTSLRVEN